MAETDVEENKLNAEAFKEIVFELKTQAQIPVISKAARVVEEIVISKTMTEREEIVRDSVKRTAVRIEKIRADDAENRENG